MRLTWPAPHRKLSDLQVWTFRDGRHVDVAGNDPEPSRDSSGGQCADRCRSGDLRVRAVLFRARKTRFSSQSSSRVPNCGLARSSPAEFSTCRRGQAAVAEMFWD
jgi:hypothetical protein